MTNNNRFVFRRSPVTPAGALSWPGYDAGDFFWAQDLLAEQQSRLQLLRRHNRFLHEWGVVCGLWVVPAKDTGKPWSIQVCPGYAIACCGDEIDLRTPKLVDIRDYLWRRPQGHIGPAFVVIRYCEQLVCPIAAKPNGCGCEDMNYQASRVKDSCQLDIIWNLPDTIDLQDFDICAQQLPVCPQCPDSGYVLLAQVTLPARDGISITRADINNGLSR